jgi:hypothetical protein
MSRVRSILPDTLRPSRVLLYRLQFGTQPQNANGPRFRLRGEPRGQQTYDLLREGVDYYIDQSLLWFALVRPLNETNERLVVAYNVRINGRDTVWTTTGGTPDVQFVASRDQVARASVRRRRRFAMRFVPCIASPAKISSAKRRRFVS